MHCAHLLGMRILGDRSRVQDYLNHNEICSFLDCKSSTSLVPDNKEEPMAEDGGSSAARLDG